MHWINFYLSAWILSLVILVNQVQSLGLFELRLKYFNNDMGRDNDGKCCSGQFDTINGKCTGTCKTRFRVCLKHYQAKIDTTSQCTFGDVVTPVLGENSVNLTNINGPNIMDSSSYNNNNNNQYGNGTNNNGFINPIPFPFNFAWPGTFTLIVEAWHDTNNETNVRSPGVLISRLSIQRVLEVSSDWTEDKYEAQNSWLQYDFRVTCDAHYYGAGCANLCRPRDDQFGHYTCSEVGEIVCLSGWQGDYCEKPRCTKGCNEQHGHCNKPNECLCHTGWKGQHCEECEPYPGCAHGTCKKPWECICNEGWGGLFCNQDLNYCTNHRPCQNGGTCRNTGQGLYTCECSPGFKGTDCEIEINNCEDEPCLNSGTCIDDTYKQTFRCECKQGWSGKHCEDKLITCADKPCLHGKCRDHLQQGFKCECPIGYSGINCDQIQVDNCTPNPCQNGASCISSQQQQQQQQQQNGGVNSIYQCKCKSGYTGERCEINIDDCQGNLCQNGGTCIDMINQFRCQCVPGFIGSLCTEKVDLCLTKPCANGGQCTNLNNDYKCQCRPGFTGKDCSIDIDECSSAPCRNGATCVNRVNSFQCYCANGYGGQQCDEELVFAANFDAHQYGTLQGRSDGLTVGQVVLIAILSIAMPVVAVIAVCVVICMKRKRKRDQEKDDAEARKQNEQNATAHHGTTIMTSSKQRGSNSGLQFDNSNPNIIKNTWSKTSVNNISGSVSNVDDNNILNTSSQYGGANYSDNNNANSDFCNIIVPQQLQRAKSQKQLNTDPSLMHRASQILSGVGVGNGGIGNSIVPIVNSCTTKDYLLDSKRISVLGEPQFCSPPRWSTQQQQQQQQQQQHQQQQQQQIVGGIITTTRSQNVVCSPPHM